MQALFLHTERSAGLGQDYRPEQFRPKPTGLTRRGFVPAAVAAGSALTIGGGFWLFNTQQRFSTRMGEVRVVALADGSVVTLNTASRMSVRFSRRQRLIRLLGGEALFDVAKDSSRPFLVAAGDLNVQAVGTSFTVRLIEGAPAQVVVREGVVEVRNAASPRSEVVRLSANMRGILAAENPVIAAAVPQSQMQRELSWREGRIAFEGASLTDASMEFARYSDIRIVIDDPDLGREEISGSFQATDPVGFGRAVAEALGARVKVDQGEVHLLR